MFIYFCLLINSLLAQVYYNDLPSETGIYHPIIIEECIGLDIGDEIGLFDANGLISNDCTNQYGEILVGSGIYDGSQITISAIGSFDFCDLNDGYQLPGWINQNLIKIKVWDASQNIEYEPEYSFVTGNGNWGEFFSVIDMLVVNELTNDNIEEFNVVNLYPNPFNASINFSYNYVKPLNMVIYNINGKKVYETILSQYENLYTWNAIGYESGIYLVNFYNEEVTFSKKINLLK